jgi:hypothetical protein
MTHEGAVGKWFVSSRFHGLALRGTEDAKLGLPDFAPQVNINRYGSFSRVGTGQGTATVGPPLRPTSLSPNLLSELQRRGCWMAQAKKSPSGAVIAAGPNETSEQLSVAPTEINAVKAEDVAVRCGGAGGFTDRYAAARPLQFDGSFEKRNHHVFRYPAKFHPPIARKLVELFSSPNDTLLDPFCGSGTLLVEGSILGRNCIGTDVDPLAVFVARAKTGLRDLPAIEAAAASFSAWLQAKVALDEQRWGSFETDVAPRDFSAFSSDLTEWIPSLPKIDHWFRRRVVLQLAEIRRAIVQDYSGDAERFLHLCFASVLRNSSNADPVPVSGLEVTSHMLAKEREGRSINPWRLMMRAVAKSLVATSEFIRDRVHGVTCAIHEVDARLLSREEVGAVSAVITSPPYLTAVDYYRRHTLEMYWLGLTKRREERLELMPRYIGRDRVGSRHLLAEDARSAHVAERWLLRFPGIKPERERAFRHYCDGMVRALDRMALVVSKGGPIVIVAGDVRFCGVHVSMLELMKDLAGERLTIADHLWYPIRNRYMSYARNHQANIAADHVLVFREQSIEGK